MAGALIPFPEMAGVASSMLIFAQMASSSGYHVVYSILFEPRLVALAAGMFGPTSVGLAVEAFVVSRERRGERVPREPATVG